MKRIILPIVFLFVIMLLQGGCARGLDHYLGHDQPTGGRNDDQGRATNANKQSNRNTKQANIIRKCYKNVTDSPEWIVVKHHFNSDGEGLTFKQKTDKSKATDKEKHALIQVHDKNAKCRNGLIESLKTVIPGSESVFTWEGREKDENLIKFVEDKISWGQFVRNIEEINLKTMVGLDEAWAEVLYKNAQADQAEREERGRLLQEERAERWRSLQAIEDRMAEREKQKMIKQQQIENAVNQQYRDFQNSFNKPKRKINCHSSTTFLGTNTECESY